MNLNRENKGNKLTSAFMSHIQKYVVFYEDNSTLKSAILRSFDQKQFSKGTDYSTLVHAMEHNKPNEVAKYLTDLFAFADFMASTNMALLVNLNGFVANSAAAVFTNLPFVYCAGNTVLCFNEIDRQSPLMAGASHVLANKPNAFGTFLALTGRAVGGQCLKSNDFVKDFALLDSVNVEHLKNRSVKNRDVNFHRDGYKPLFGHKLNRYADVDNSVGEFFERSKSENAKNVLFDLFYRKKIIEHANFKIRKDLQHPDDWLRIDDRYYSAVENYLYTFDLDVLSSLPELMRSELDMFGHEELAVVLRVFTKRTLEEVFGQLEREHGAFAGELLELLRRKNLDVLEVIFRQVRLAEGMTFGESLRMEFATALAMSEHSHFKDQLFRVSHRSESRTPSPADFQKARTLADSVLSDGRQLEVPFAKVPQAFLPVKSFYSTFPESVRCYFNGQAVRRADLFHGFKDTVESVLYRYGFDSFSPSFDKMTVLAKLRQFLDWRKKTQVKENRLLELVQFPELMAEYFDSRERAIERVGADQGFQGAVEEILGKVFEDELTRVEEDAGDRYRVLAKVEQWGHFEKLKKLVIERLSFSSKQTEEQRHFQVEQLLNMPLEVGFDRFSLGRQSQEHCHLEALRRNYTTQVNVSSKGDLKSLYRGLLLPKGELSTLKRTGDEQLTWDRNRILRSPTEGLFENLRNTSADFSYAKAGKETKVERSFRQLFVQTVFQALGRMGQKLTKLQKRQVVALVNKDVVMKHRTSSDPIDAQAFQDTHFFHYLRVLKPNYEAIDLTKFDLVKVKANQKQSEVVSGPSLAEVDSIRQLNELQFKEGTSGEFQMDSGKDSLMKLLLDNEVMPEGQKTQLRVILGKSGVQLLDDLKDQLLEIYETKFVDLFGNSKVCLNLREDSSGLSVCFNNAHSREAHNEFCAFLLPHLMFNWSNYSVNKLEDLFNRVAIIQQAAEVELKKALKALQSRNATDIFKSKKHSQFEVIKQQLNSSRPGVDPNAEALNDILHKVNIQRESSGLDGNGPTDEDQVVQVCQAQLKARLSEELHESGFQVGSSESVDQVIDFLDQLLNFMLETNFFFRKRLNFKEDLIYVLAEEVRQVFLIKQRTLMKNAQSNLRHTVVEGKNKEEMNEWVKGINAALVKMHSKHNNNVTVHPIDAKLHELMKSVERGQSAKAKEGAEEGVEGGGEQGSGSGGVGKEGLDGSGSQGKSRSATGGAVGKDDSRDGGVSSLVVGREGPSTEALGGRGSSGRTLREDNDGVQGSPNRKAANVSETERPYKEMALLVEEASGSKGRSSRKERKLRANNSTADLGLKKSGMNHDHLMAEDNASLSISFMKKSIYENLKNTKIHPLLEKTRPRRLDRKNKKLFYKLKRTPRFNRFWLDLRNRERVFEKFSQDDQNVFNKLNSYSTTLQQYLRTLNTSVDVDFGADGGQRVLVGNDRTRPKVGKRSRELFFQEVVPQSLDLFIDGFLVKDSQAQKDFKAIRRAIEVSFFGEMTHKLCRFEAGLRSGVLAEAEGSRLFDSPTLRNAVVKRCIADGVDFEDRPEQVFYDTFLQGGVFKEVQRLSTLSKNYLSDNKPSCMDPFYHSLEPELVRIPEAFGEFDVRQKPEEWLRTELYKYCLQVFESFKTASKDSGADPANANIAAFFDPSLVAHHFRSKLAVEKDFAMRFMHKFHSSQEELTARMTEMIRAESADLDWKKQMENEHLAKKFLAVETFAFHGSVNSQSRTGAYLEYLDQLSKEMFDPVRRKQPLKKRTADPPKQYTADVEFVPERLFEEVVSSVNRKSQSEHDSLKREISEALIGVEKRLQIYK